MTETELGRRCGDAIVRLWIHHPVVPDGGTHADLIRALASVPPGHLRSGGRLCLLCAPGLMGEDGRAPAHGQHGHGHGCPWALARAWVLAHPLPEVAPDTCGSWQEAHDGADEPEVEPPLWDDGPNDPADRVR